jgi:urocanate hydratase
VINGGFGLVLDGSEEVDVLAKSMLAWDVYNGVSRRSWSGNQNAKETIIRAMNDFNDLKVTIPNNADENVFKLK